MTEETKIKKALARFEAAISRLETSMSEVGEISSSLDSTRGEVVALRKDREQLLAELDEVRNRAEELFKINHQAAKRIDLAAERINRVLGE